MITENKDERIEDLGNGLKAVQRMDYFCFGIDAVLLSNFAVFKKDARVAEFCAGNAVVSILLTEKQQAQDITAFEFQPEMFDLAKKSVALSGVEDKVKLVCDDVLNAGEYIEAGSLDAIVVNPPYVKRSGGLACMNRQRTLARKETTLIPEELFKVSNKLLRHGGELFMVHRPDRLVDIFHAARTVRLEPKTMTMVYPKPDRAPNIVLLKFKKGAGQELKQTPPIYLYELE